MRHAPPQNLERIAPLLHHLRSFDGLTERTSGVSYRRGLQPGLNEDRFEPAVARRVATDVNGHWLASDTTFCALAKLGRGCLPGHLVGRIRPT
jgi:hypothetical protein